VYCPAGLSSLLVAEDEPEDVRPTDHAILSTAAIDHRRKDVVAESDKRRRRSAPVDVAATVDMRRRHALLPGNDTCKVYFLKLS